MTVEHSTTTDTTQLTWRTADGRVLSPADFDDEHLINTIRFIERNAEGAKVFEELRYMNAGSFLQGDMAEYAADQELQQIERMSIQEWLFRRSPIYGAIRKEAEKRKLRFQHDLSDDDVWTEPVVESRGLTHPYVCTKGCGADWMFDPDDGKCPICRQKGVMPKSLVREREAKE